MKCQRFQEELFEYLDGSLSAAAQAAMDAHLADCPACRQVVQAHKALADRFQHETECLTLRPGLLNRVLSAAKEPPAPPFAVALWHRFVWPVAIAAALAVAAGLSFDGLFRPSVQRNEAAPGPAPAIVSIRFTSCQPTYIFRRQKDQVIDALTCTPEITEENLSLPLNQKPIPSSPETRTPL